MRVKEGVEPISPTQFVLLLHSVPHLGEKGLTRLLRLNAQNRLGPQDCLTLTAEEWEQRYELHAQSARYLTEHREALLAKSAEMARALRAYGLSILTVESATYPRNLDRYDDAPPPIPY